MLALMAVAIGEPQDIARGIDAENETQVWRKLVDRLDPTSSQEETEHRHKRMDRWRSV